MNVFWTAIDAAALLGWLLVAASDLASDKRVRDSTIFWVAAFAFLLAMRATGEWA